MASIRTRKTKRVFVDSSVLIAAAISGRGAARDLIRRGFRGEIDLCIAPEVLEESERNLSAKAPVALADFYIFRDLLAGKLVDPPASLVLACANVVALKDAPIVAGAIHASATHLATYDRKHLLQHKEKIREQFGVIVVVPDEIIKARP